MKHASVRITYSYDLALSDSLIDAFKQEFKFSDEAEKDEYEMAHELAAWYFTEHAYQDDNKHVFSHFSQLECVPDYDDISIESIEDVES